MTPLLTPREAAEALGISIDQLAALADDGAIPFVNVGRGQKRPARRYEPDDIAAFRLARRQIECPSTGAMARKPTPTTSGFRVIDFQATLEKRRSERRRPTNA